MKSKSYKKRRRDDTTEVISMRTVNCMAQCTRSAELKSRETAATTMTITLLHDTTT